MPLRVAVAPAATQAIDTAFKKLEKAIAPGDALGFANTTLDDVRAAALQIEEQMAARGSLRNMKRLMPLFTALEHYSSVMEVLCNGTPYLPWLWAPIKLILRIASEYVEAFDVLTSAYHRIAEAMPRIQLLSRTFERNPQFQKTLAVYYTDILTFHGHAYAFLYRRGWRLLFKTSWGRFKIRFDSLLEGMRHHECLIDSVANAHHIAASAVEREANKAMRQELQKWLDDSRNRLADAERNDASQYMTAAAWLKADESAADQISLFEKLASDGTRFPGTCSWLLQNRNIKSWLSSSADPSLLLIEGAPGTGKSVLAAKIVAFLRTAGKFSVGHFCSYSYTKSTIFHQVLRSLILQILRRDKELVSFVVDKYVLSIREPSTAVLQDILKHLVANFGASVSDPDQLDGPGRSAPADQLEHIWIVLDGLDECTPETQASVISLARQLASVTSSYSQETAHQTTIAQGPIGPNSGIGVICKILIASRPVPTIRSRLRRGVVTVSFSKEKQHLNHAIQEYVRGRLGEDMGSRISQLHVGVAEQDGLIAAIVRKADGMFLYARLLLNYISSNLFYTGHELLESVNRLPDELATFYQNILNRTLANLDERSSDRLRCILGWIAFSKRPLRKLEFMSAVTFSQGDPTVTQIAPLYILDTITALVEERSDTALGFIHVSVKEYVKTLCSSTRCTNNHHVPRQILTSFHTNFNSFLQNPKSPIVLNKMVSMQEHGVATITCLLASSQLLHAGHTDYYQFQRLVEGTHGLHVYATEYWADYLLSHAASFTNRHANGEVASSAMIDLALRLADETQRQSPHSITTSVNETSTFSSAGMSNGRSLATSSGQVDDERLCYIEAIPRLHRFVSDYLMARSLDGLRELFDKEDVDSGAHSKEPGESVEKTIEGPVYLSSITHLLASYQAKLGALLDLSDLPGVSARDFQQFKTEFYSSRYTCRLSTCLRATLGLDSVALRCEHEQVHLRRFFNCIASGCHWTPFESAAALRRHTKRHHSEQGVPRSIRMLKRVEPTEDVNWLKFGDDFNAFNGSKTMSLLPNPVSTDIDTRATNQFHHSTFRPTATHPDRRRISIASVLEARSCDTTPDLGVYHDLNFSPWNE